MQPLPWEQRALAPSGRCVPRANGAETEKHHVPKQSYRHRLSRQGRREASHQERHPLHDPSLATKESWKDRAGEWQSRTEWHRCIIWGAKFADFAAAIKKGARVQVEGELQSREYEKDGVKHRIVEIRTKSILKLDRAKQQTEAVPQEAEPTDVPF